MMKDSKNSVIY